MVRKCSVFGCRTGYRNEPKEKKVAVYSFPKDSKERKKWVSCLPNQMKLENVTDNMGVCALHWPTDAPMVLRGRYHVPSIPPSIFPNVPPSCIPSTSQKSASRQTERATQAARAMDIDEMSEFQEMDSLKAETFHNVFTTKLKPLGLLATDNDTRHYVLISRDRNGPISKFSLYFELESTAESIQLHFEAYRGLKRLRHPFIKEIKCWSSLDEILRFEKTGDESVPEDKKVNYLTRNVNLINANRNGRIYDAENLLLAFTWYSQSRSLYLQMREYLQLPSLATLKKITCVAKNKSEDEIFSSIFSSLGEKSKYCILRVDEIYVKATISYRGGTLFGYAADCPGKLATTLLCVMVKCFFGSKNFLARLLPCHALTAQFQFNQVQDLIVSLENCGAKVIAIVNDNNRVNQSFFSMFPKVNPNSPWVASSPVDSSRPLFLIYDPVHLLKNIRNNWLTEKNIILEFPLPDAPETKAAKWSDLQELHQHEQLTLLTLSDLTKASLNPNNIEKQKVSLALKVFSEKTSVALKTSTSSTQSWHDTACFIDLVLKLWKVFNTKTPVQHIRFRDSDRAAVADMESGQLEILRFWAACADKMKPLPGPRAKSLTRDTAQALTWTCNCLIALCEHLLTTESPVQHQYIAIGFFQQGDIERHFAHFRMSAGSNYYITAQDVANTHGIDRAKLMLENYDEIDYTAANHTCSLCETAVTEAELRLLDDLPESVSIISADERMALFFIGGYVASKDHKLQGEPSSVPQEVRIFTEKIDRGGLSYPSHCLYELLLYFYKFFTTTEVRCCRKRLVDILLDFPALYHLNLELDKTAAIRIVNVLMKKFTCQNQETNCGQQQRRKLAKLSSL